MKEFKLAEDIIDIIENNNFVITSLSIQDDDYLIEFAQRSPLGEDWHEIVWLKADDAISEVAEKFNEFAYDFDEEDAAFIFIVNRGQHGIPDSISDLLEDAKWKKEVLTSLANNLKEELKDRDEPAILTEK